MMFQIIRQIQETPLDIAFYSFARPPGRGWRHPEYLENLDIPYTDQE